MSEILLFINLCGLALSARRRMGVANPFFIYFTVWSAIFFGYYLSAESFIPASPIFLLLIITASSLAFVILILAYIGVSKNNIAQGPERIYSRKRFLQLAQIVCALSVPFAYQQANALSGGVDIFTVLGYIYLRSAMTEEGQSFGVLTYFPILSYVLTSIYLYRYCAGHLKIFGLVVSVLVSVFYAYINTARTGVLLLLLLMVLPLFLKGYIGFKGGAISVGVLLALFVFIATMTAKGVSIEAEVGENVTSLLENLRSYTIAPFLAFSQLEKSLENFSWGANSFRLFFSIASALGVYEGQALSVAREYVYVPDPTNVYTVYDTYFRDFSYFGVLIPPAFLCFHWWLYKKARNLGGRWIFLYSASIYPLAMQFFADQYFSLLSIWIQLIFWYWLFLPSQLSASKDGRNVTFQISGKAA
jgi:oligosaccharide repeat unit polymerase